MKQLPFEIILNVMFFLGVEEKNKFLIIIDKDKFYKMEDLIIDLIFQKNVKFRENSVLIEINPRCKFSLTRRNDKIIKEIIKDKFFESNLNFKNWIKDF